MSDNLRFWDSLGKTDPAHTKPFQRAGGFKGTAIKPMFSYKRMTEEFGPCGEGWGINQPTFQVVPAGDEILVYCTVSIWHSQRENTVYGVGGDKVLAKFTSSLKTDDEAFKKAFTDAVTNALKLIGVGADVHMGMFDDSKYVNDMSTHFAEPKVEIIPVEGEEFLLMQNEIKGCENVDQLKSTWEKINLAKPRLNDDQYKALGKTKDEKKTGFIAIG